MEGGREEAASGPVGGAGGGHRQEHERKKSLGFPTNASKYRTLESYPHSRTRQWQWRGRGLLGNERTSD